MGRPSRHFFSIFCQLPTPYLSRVYGDMHVLEDQLSRKARDLVPGQIERIINGQHNKTLGLVSVEGSMPTIYSTSIAVSNRSPSSHAIATQRSDVSWHCISAVD